QSLSLYAFLVIRALSSFPTRRSSDLRIRLVVGILDNRPVEKMGTILASILGAKLHRVYVTTVPDAKTAPSARLVRCFQGLGVSTVALDDPLTALKTALAELEEDESLVEIGRSHV